MFDFACIIMLLFLMTLRVGGVIIRIRLADGSIRRLDVDESISASKLKLKLNQEGMISNIAAAKLQVQTGMVVYLQIHS
jgi:hypothetical protein